MNWKAYQEEVAEFFRALGCDAQVEAIVTGARGVHEIDVWVQFKKFGLQVKWAVECKAWNTNVPKEKVLALQTMVNDIGADRGFLISTTGFQSGAIRASERTNITLTNLEDLRKITAHDLVHAALDSLKVRVAKVKHALVDLYVIEPIHYPGGATGWRSSPKPGADASALDSAIGSVGVLEVGLDQVRVGKAPYPLRFRDSDKGMIRAATLEDFVRGAAAILEGAEATLNEQLAAVARGDKTQS